MNKKKRCTQYNCDICKTGFKTHTEYDIHKRECAERENRHKIYETIYSKKTIIIEVNMNWKITYISKNSNKI